jgi:hypothetical protein
MADNIIKFQARRAAKDAAAAPATITDEQRADLIAEIAERLRLLGPGWRISYSDAG